MTATPPTKAKPTPAKRISLVVLGGIAALALVAAKLDTILDFLDKRSVPALDGTWLLTDSVVVAEVSRFEGLRVQFRVFIQQDGRTITGQGLKIAVNGTVIAPKDRSAIRMSGRIRGNTVIASFEETPPGSTPQYRSQGNFRWSITRRVTSPTMPQRMEGTFVSTARDSRGTSIAIREQ